MTRKRITDSFSGQVEETNDLLLGRDGASKNTPFCGKPPHIICLIACAEDHTCKTLGYNRTGVACGCACQRCGDGKYYRATNDYKKAKPLTTDQRKSCLDITHPCKKQY